MNSPQTNASQRDHDNLEEQSERRSWFIALGVGVLAHVILLGALIMADRGSASPDATRDVPITRGMLGDAVEGPSLPPGTEELDAGACVYMFDAVNQVARLTSGPPHASGQLGCRETLSFTGMTPWLGELTAKFESDGRLVEINDTIIDPRDPVPLMVQSWDLATPRDGRQWPGMPKLTLRIEGHE